MNHQHLQLTRRNPCRVETILPSRRPLRLCLPRHRVRRRATSRVVQGLVLLSRPNQPKSAINQFFNTLLRSVNDASTHLHTIRRPPPLLMHNNTIISHRRPRLFIRELLCFHADTHVRARIDVVPLFFGGVEQFCCGEVGGVGGEEV